MATGVRELTDWWNFYGVSRLPRVVPSLRRSAGTLSLDLIYVWRHLVSRLLALMFFVAVTMSASVVFAADLSSPLLIQTTTQRNYFKVGTDIEIYVTVTNRTSRPIVVTRAVSSNMAELDFEFAVSDQSGNVAHLIDPERDPPAGSEIMTDLGPREYFREAAIITKLFDMTRPGIYTIFVRCRENFGVDAGAPDVKPLQVIIYP